MNKQEILFLFSRHDAVIPIYETLEAGILVAIPDVKIKVSKTLNGRRERMKILCFGDSNTYGYDPRSFFGNQYPAERRWVNILAKKLGCKAVNAGEKGREIPTRANELFWFDLMMTNQKPVDLLLIMLGVNDLLQGNDVSDVVKRMDSFLQHIEQDKSKILLIGPPPMQPGEWVSTQGLIDASIKLNYEYKKLAENLGVPFVDAGAWNISLTFDGVHFTEDGHRSFAEGIYNYLSKRD